MPVGAKLRSVRTATSGGLTETTIAGFVQPVGYPGPSSQAAYDALNNHHVSDMFANYLTGKKSIDDTIADAKKRLGDSLVKFPVG